MKITFGLALDGFRPTSGFFNHLFCGPQGLASALEVRLGLSTKLPGRAERVRQYLDCLSMLPGNHFFSESLAADRWGTAAELLDLRDQLRMAGWDGTATDSAPPRLRDLAEVEKLALGRLAPGLSDRLEAIGSAFQSGAGIVSDVRCVDPADFLPHRIRCLLDKIGAASPAATEKLFSEEELASQGTNLRLVQEYLLGREVSGKWGENDDSVTFATAFSEVTLAHSTAQLLKSQDSGSLTLLATAPSGPLPDVLNICSSASPPLDDSSPLRPIAQVLTLALEMLWEPPDPSKLLQFLSHPVCPITFSLRRNLAAAVADRPGMGSDRWKEAIKKARASIAESPDSKDHKIDPSRIDSDLRDWLPAERYPRQPGAPGSALAAVAGRLASWANRRASTSQGDSTAGHFVTLASTASELAETLAGLPFVPPEELSIILDQVSGSGTGAGIRYAELGSPRCLGNAGAVIEPADSLIWWGFELQEPKVKKFWSLSERQFFEDNHIHLPKTETLLSLGRAHGLRPFLSTRKQIILLWPRQRGGEPVAPHPLKTLLDTKFGHLPVRDLDRDEIELLKPARKVLSLPAKKRWVHLNESSNLSSREVESYSSLSKFVFRPFEWVFHYKAKLQRGSVMAINPMTQRGNLLHRVVERMLEVGGPIDWLSVRQPDFDAWLEALWPQLLATEGANFLLPGSQTGGQKLQEDARRATWDLIGHMRKARVTEAKADVAMGPIRFTENTSIRGDIDLLVTNEDGRSAVVDLKYGQGSKRQELETNTALQLATYGMLMNAESGNWPDIAYFILRSSTLLTLDREYFPDATFCAGSGATSPQSTWNTFLDVWKWRRSQLDAGWVEISNEGSVPPADSSGPPLDEPPHPEWTPDPKAPRYDDFATLTGWEEAQ